MTKQSLASSTFYTQLSTFRVDNTPILNQSNALMVCFVLMLLSTKMCLANGYTNAELKALSERERNVPQASASLPELNPRALLEKARQFELQSKNQLDKALSPLLNTGRHHPNESAKGVMVFVSLSMPDTSLRQLLMQSADLQVPLIVRGVLPTGFTGTVKRMNKLIKNKNKPINSGFAINPQWFTQFGITQVPAFVAIKRGKCQAKQPCHPDDFDVIYGNVSLYDALNLLAQQGDVPDIAANALNINTLSGEQ